MIEAVGELARTAVRRVSDRSDLRWLGIALCVLSAVVTIVILWVIFSLA